MGWFLNLRSVNRQAKVAAIIAAYVELAVGKKMRSADKFAADVIEMTLRDTPHLFNPDFPAKPDKNCLAAFCMAVAIMKVGDSGVDPVIEEGFQIIVISLSKIIRDIAPGYGGLDKFNQEMFDAAEHVLLDIGNEKY